MSAVKDKILNVASELFFKNGFNITGINQIVAESGVAIGSLYKHFPSKTDLLMAYLTKSSEGYFTALNAYLEKANSPKSKLLAIFDFHIEFQRHTDYSGCNFIKIFSEISKSETKVIDMVKAHKDKLYHLVKELAAEIKDIDLEKAKMAGDMIYLLLEGAIVDSTIQKEINFFSSAKKIIKNMI